MRYGYFDDERDEYVVERPDVPVSWTNYIGVKDLCAVLSGNIPGAASSASAALRCGEERDCTLEIQSDEVTRRVLLRYPPAGSNQDPRILSQELYRAGKLVYEARFERMQEISHYHLPIVIVIENPEKKMLLTLQYTEVEVNTPISGESFQLGDEADGKSRER